jgi:hypothetical protein
MIIRHTREVVSNITQRPLPLQSATRLQKGIKVVNVEWNGEYRLLRPLVERFRNFRLRSSRAGSSLGKGLN